MRRHIQRKEMGEAISLEDVLSLMTVIFVLFVLFFVPLVNIDRMQLEKAQRDVYWQQLAEWLADNAKPEPTTSYGQAFSLDGNRLLKSKDPLRSEVTWIEALDADGSITVVEHNQQSDRYYAMVVKGHSSVISYRYGRIRWSGDEDLWFTSADSLDYGNLPESQDFKQRFKNWTMTSRGF